MARTAPDLQGDALTRQLPDIARATNANRILRGAVRRGSDGLVLDLAWSEPGGTIEDIHIAANGRDAAALFGAYETSLQNALASIDMRAGAPPPLAPLSTEAFGRGLVALDARQYDVAAKELASATATAPAGALATMRLLDAQENAREDLPAQNTREDAVKRFATDPNPTARELYARALSGSGEAEKSAASLAAAVKDFPHDPALALLYAQTLDENGNGTEAMAVLQRAVESDDEDARAWFLLGRTAIQQAQAGRGVDDYLLHALVLNVRSGNAAAEAETRNAMGIGYEHVGKLDASAEAYTAPPQSRKNSATSARWRRRCAISRSCRPSWASARRPSRRSIAPRDCSRRSAIRPASPICTTTAASSPRSAAISRPRSRAYKESLAIRRRIDDPTLIAESLDNVGFSSYQLGNFDDALVYWQQALDLYRKVDDKRGTLHVEQSIGLLDIAQGHFAVAQERLQASLGKAEDAQLPEEVAAAQITLADLYLLEGRFTDAVGAADRAQQFFSRRSDERGEIETNLAKARIALALGDGDAADKALAAIPSDRINSEQRAGYLLAAARRAALAGDIASARAKLDDASKAADASHSGTLDFRIKLEQARTALAAGDRAAADALLSALGTRTTQLGQVPFRLEWLELEIAASLRSDRKADAASRYREALGAAEGHGTLRERGRAARARRARAAARRRRSIGRARGSRRGARAGARGCAAGFEADPASGDRSTPETGYRRCRMIPRSAPCCARRSTTCCSSSAS